MIPVIIYGGMREERAKEIELKYPLTQFALSHIQADVNSITIAQIQELVTILAITSRVPRLVWIENADNLTMPAQNALLKLLEEPPERTTIILSCRNHHSLVPTVLSRCTLFKIQGAATDSTVGDCLKVIKEAMSRALGDRIVLASSLGRKRDQLITWTDQCLLEIDSKMRNERAPSRLKVLGTIAKLVTDAANDLATNVSTGLAIQHLFLHLPRSK